MIDKLQRRAFIGETGEGGARFARLLVNYHATSVSWILRFFFFFSFFRKKNLKNSSSLSLSLSLSLLNEPRIVEAFDEKREKSQVVVKKRREED